MACGLARHNHRARYGRLCGKSRELPCRRAKNISSLANALVKLVTDKELRLKLSEAGRGVVKSFNWSCASQSMEDVLNEVLQVSGEK